MDGLSLLFEQVPWTKPLLAWLFTAILVILFWALLTFPAYLLEPFLSKARQQVAGFATIIGNKYLAIWDGCGTEVKRRFNSFYAAHSFRHVRDKNQALWARTIKRLTEPLDSLIQALGQSAARVYESAQSLSQATERLRAVEPRLPKLPTLPGADSLLEELKRIRRERTNLLIAGSIVVAIVIVNTGMLSQILKDVVEIGALKIIGDIRLYHIFAALLTLIEAGVGVLHGILKLKGDDTRTTEHPYFPQLLTVMGAVCLALIEGFFYSRVGDPKQTFSFPLINLNLDMQQVFFLWGFILPLMLFGLGYFCYSSIMGLRIGYSLRDLRSWLKALRGLTELLSRGIDDLHKSLARAKEHWREGPEMLPEYSEGRGKEILKSVQQVRGEMEEIGRTNPEWAVKIFEPLTEAEMRQQALRVGAWLLILMLTSALSIWIQVTVIPRIYPVIWTRLALILSVTGCAILLGAGLGLRPAGMVAEGAGILVSVEGPGTTIRRVAAALAVVITLGLGTLALVKEAIPKGHGLAWTLVLAFAVLLVGIGPELPSIVSLFISGVAAAVVIGQGILAILIVWLLRILVAIFLVLEFIVMLLAVPTKWFRRTRPEATISQAA